MYQRSHRLMIGWYENLAYRPTLASWHGNHYCITSQKHILRPSHFWALLFMLFRRKNRSMFVFSIIFFSWTREMNLYNCLWKAYGKPGCKKNVQMLTCKQYIKNALIVCCLHIEYMFACWFNVICTLIFNVLTTRPLRLVYMLKFVFRSAFTASFAVNFNFYIQRYVMLGS